MNSVPHTTSRGITGEEIRQQAMNEAVDNEGSQDH